MTASGGKLVLAGLRKVFNGNAVVTDFNLAVGEGEFVALLGPSGCGKSTTLSMIAGFERPDGGEILLNGRRLNEVAPQHRHIGLVPQDYAVFSRLTVAENLDFGLRARKLPRAIRRERLEACAERLDLRHIWTRRGGSLNVSEMQRVALARSLITEPSVVLLDEPMSNLDAGIRAKLRVELKGIQRDFKQTIIYVTHDQIEAMAMADRIVVMQDGAIRQVGTPLEVYRNPLNRFVAEFIGEPRMNILRGRVGASTDAAQAGETSFRTSGGVDIPLTAGAFAVGEFLLGIRPHDVIVTGVSRRGAVPAKVIDVENLGAEYLLHLDLGSERLAAIVPRRSAAAGDTVFVAVDIGKAVLFDPVTQLARRPGLPREAAA